MHARSPIDLSRKHCINLYYFVGAKHLGENLTEKLEIWISQMLRPAPSVSHNLIYGEHSALSTLLYR